MSPELIAILAVGVSIIALLSRMSIRLTAVEKETARLSGLLEGLGLAGPELLAGVLVPLQPAHVGLIDLDGAGEWRI